MKPGIVLFIIGTVMILYLANVKFGKKFISKLGIIFGILLLLYGLILVVQPDEFIVYTKTTIAK
jgi:hypothetical protein